MNILEEIKKLKNKWLVKEIVDFEKCGHPGKVEINFDSQGNANTCEPKPIHRKPKDG